MCIKKTKILVYSNINQELSNFKFNQSCNFSSNVKFDICNSLSKSFTANNKLYNKQSVLIADRKTSQILVRPNFQNKTNENKNLTTNKLSLF